MENQSKRKRGRPRKNPEQNLLPQPSNPPGLNPEPNPEPNPENPGGSAPSSDRFEAVAATIAPVIGDEGTPEGGGNISGSVLPPEPQGWTPDRVADQLRAVFTSLALFRGEHWEIPEEKITGLGELWCPLFVRHVPYTAGGEVMEWALAFGGLVGVLKEPLKKEIAEFKRNRNPGSTMGGSTMAGYPASPGSSASLALARVSPPKD